MVVLVVVVMLMSVYVAACLLVRVRVLDSRVKVELIITQNSLRRERRLPNIITEFLLRAFP